MGQQRRTVTLNLRDREWTVLEELCEKRDLSKVALLRQALRLYQVFAERSERGEKLYFEDETTKEKAELMVL